jgi:ATP phosphoribosyltransferase regulatory subunit
MSLGLDFRRSERSKLKVNNNWLLPDGIDECLPEKAERIERVRRAMIDILTGWGYRLVIPPMIEYLESLLAGMGEDLNLQTFKITDQRSGRAMGVRADITPQIARIDAHRLPSDVPQRFCYAGPVVHTQPEKFAGSRNPLQIGAEIYGSKCIESDVEVIALMLECLSAAGILHPTIEVAHVEIFHGICAGQNFDQVLEKSILEALLKKDKSGLCALLGAADASEIVVTNLTALLELNGDVGVLMTAKAKLAGAPQRVQNALEELSHLSDILIATIPHLELHVDLAEMRAYQYHTGIMFAAYISECGRAIAWGGRYDNIGRLFGRERGATGFSTDLKVLESFFQQKPKDVDVVYAPKGFDESLLEAINDCRRTGTIVVQELPDQIGGADELGCNKILIKIKGIWVIKAIPC